MRNDHSVTQWIQGLKGGDEDSAAKIWERFFGRVCSLANQRLGSVPRVATDAEDVALSAIHALCSGARADRFRQLQDRGDLWDVLALITVRKSIDARRKAHRITEPVNWSDASSEDLQDPNQLQALVDDGYVKVLCATGEEMVGRLEPKLRDVAMLRLEGYSNAEIAARTGRSLPTVERHLRMIRHLWQSEAP